MPAGFVYLFRASIGPVKIGRSKAPEGRLEDFDSLPFEVVLLHTIASDDMVWLERTLHERFADKRIRGEWFALSDDDIAALLTIASSNRPSDDVTPKRSGKPLHLSLSAELYDQLIAHIESLRPRVTTTAIVETALEEYLAKHQDPPDEPSDEPEE